MLLMLCAAMKILYVFLVCIVCAKCLNHLFLHFITNDTDEWRPRKRILFESQRLEGIFESKKNAISYRFLVYLTTFSKCIAYIASYMKRSCLLPSRICLYDWYFT